ncbi:unnamed protein product, partial [Staurois parvus]
MTGATAGQLAGSNRWLHCWAAALLGCTDGHLWVALLGTGGCTAGHRRVHCWAQVGGTAGHRCAELVGGTDGHRSSGPCSDNCWFLAHEESAAENRQLHF